MSSPSPLLRRLALAASLLVAVAVGVVAAVAVAAGPSAAQGPSSSSSSVPSSSSTIRPTTTTTTFRPTSTTFRPSTTASTRPPSTTTTTRRPVSTTSTVVTTTTTTDPDEGFSATTVARPTTTVAPSTAPSTTAPPTVDTSEVSGEGGGLRLVVGGLVGVAALISGLTFLYWRHTRPMADELVPYGEPLDPVPAGDVTGAPLPTESGATGAAGSATAATAASVIAASPSDGSSEASVGAESSASAGGESSADAGAEPDHEATLDAGAALVAGGVAAVGGSATETSGPPEEVGAHALANGDGEERTLGEAGEAGDPVAGGLDPDARTAMSPVVVAPLLAATTDAAAPDAPPAAGTSVESSAAGEQVEPAEAAGPVLFDQEVARTAEVPVVAVADSDDAGIDGIPVDDPLGGHDIAPIGVEAVADEPGDAVGASGAAIGVEATEHADGDPDVDPHAAGVDDAETDEADADLDQLPPPPVVPKARKRVEPSGVTILGPVRSRERSSADDERAAVDPDAPMRIVTIEDIERDRRFDEGGASSGVDEPEDRS